ncbi:hypothetical protein ACP4OV_031450 [Aristida adscensionis]
MYMAASLGLGNETYYYSSPPAAAAAAASCFGPIDIVADADHSAAHSFFTPPAAAAANFFPELGAACCRHPDEYCSLPAPVFAGGGAAASDMMSMNCGDVYGRTASESAGNGGRRPPPSRIGFRTRSEVDVLDDGFKWRKYGKKAVKSSPNPRNYYRCSVEGCGVKKRVERDRDDPRCVLTTYDGVHNHATPGRGGGGAPPPHGASPATMTPYSSAPLQVGTAPSVPGFAGHFDAWGMQLHPPPAAVAAAAHSSESSY